MSYGVPNQFTAQGGNVPTSQLDADFTAVLTGVNNAFLTGTLAARPAPSQPNGAYYFATDVNGGTLYRDNGSLWQQVAPSVTGLVLRSYLAGLQLSTAGGSGTMTIGAGQATDSTNAVY